MKNLDQKGQSILEGLIGAALIAIVLAAVIQLTNHNNSLLSIQRLSANEHRKFTELSKLIGMPGALRNSMPNSPYTSYFNLHRPPAGNTFLADCMAGGNCGSPPQYLPFVLVGPSIDRLSNGTYITDGPLTGSSPSQAMPFDNQGYPCLLQPSQCPAAQYPYGIYTELMSICPPAPLPSGGPVDLTTAFKPQAACTFAQDSDHSGVAFIVGLKMVDRTRPNTPLIAQSKSTVWSYLILSGTWW